MWMSTPAVMEATPELIPLPPKVIDSSSDTICLLSGQRQGQGSSQFHSFQICTVFLAMAAFLLGGKQEMLEQEPKGAGSHAQVVLASWPEQEGIFNTGSTVFPGGSKTMPTL